MPITADDARELAKLLLEASHELGIYRFANWKSLTKAQRDKIEGAEWDLLNCSTKLTTAAVGIELKTMQSDLKAIKGAMKEARKTIATIKTARKVIAIAGAMVMLGGALASRDPGAIMKAVKGVSATVKTS